MVTAIKLQQVYTPVSKGLGIKVIVAITARVASTGFVSNIPINPQFQPFRMDLRETGEMKTLKVGWACPVK